MWICLCTHNLTSSCLGEYESGNLAVLLFQGELDLGKSCAGFFILRDGVLPSHGVRCGVVVVVVQDADIDIDIDVGMCATAVHWKESLGKAPTKERCKNGEGGE